LFLFYQEGTEKQDSSKEAQDNNTTAVTVEATVSKPITEEVDNPESVNQTLGQESDVQPPTTTENTDINTATTVASKSTESKPSEEVENQESVEQTETRGNDAQPSSTTDDKDQNTATVAASSTESKPSEEVGNQENVEQTQPEKSDTQLPTATDDKDATTDNTTTTTEEVAQESVEQSSQEVNDAAANIIADNKDEEKNSGKENNVTEDGKTSAGEEHKAGEESSKDLITNNEKETREINNVENVVHQDLGNNDPATESAEVTDEKVDTKTTKAENNITNPNDQPTADKSDDVKSSKTENDDQNKDQNAAEENKKSEKAAAEINTEHQKDDAKHKSGDAAKNETEDQPGMTNESKEQPTEIKASNNQEDIVKPNESNNTEKSVAENLSETVTKSESVAPNEKTESDTSKENDHVEGVTSNEADAVNIIETTAGNEFNGEGTKTEKVEDEDGGKNSETAEHVEKDSGEKLLSKESNDVVKDAQSDETREDSVEGNNAGETLEQQASVTKDQDNTDPKNENITGGGNPETETKGKAVELKTTSDIEDSEVTQGEKLPENQTENPTEELSQENGKETISTISEAEPKGSKPDEASGSDIEHGAVKDGVDQTTSGANETGEVKTVSDETVATSEIAATEVKNEDAAPSLTETATNETEGKSGADTTHDKNSSSEENEVVETAIKQDEIGQDEAVNISKKTDVVEPEKDTPENQTDQDSTIDGGQIDTDGGVDRAPSSGTTANTLTEEIVEESKDAANYAKTSEGKEVESKEKSIEKLVESDTSGDIETPAVTTDHIAETIDTGELQNMTDKTAEQESDILETFKSEEVEESGQSKPEAIEGNQSAALKEKVSETEVDDKKDAEKGDESKSDCGSPAVDQDNVVDSSVQNAVHESKIIESNDESVELKDRDTDACVNQASDGTTVESKDEGPTASKGQDVDLEPKDKNDEETTTKPNCDESGTITTSKDVSNGDQEPKEAINEGETAVEFEDENRDENLDSEKTIKASEEENSLSLVTESNDPGVDTETTVESKEEISDVATIIESKDDKTTVETNEGSAAPVEYKEESNDEVSAPKSNDENGMFKETQQAAKVSKDTEKPIEKAMEEPIEVTEDQKVNELREEEGYVIVDHEDVQTEESIETEVLCQDTICGDVKPDDKNTEESCEASDSCNDVRKEEQPEEEKAKAGQAEPPSSSKERPVVEITAEFLELMEGFCMAVSQEFPSDIIDFACRYFQRIHKRRNALRKYSIEVSDLALFSDVNWIGNI
jgi:clumping factor B